MLIPDHFYSVETGGDYFGANASLTVALHGATLTDGSAGFKNGKLPATDASLTTGVSAAKVVTTTAGQSMTGGHYYGATATLTDTLKAGTVTASIGTFRTIYGGDLFLSADLVVNGSTTYSNTTNASFEDLTLSDNFEEFLTLPAYEYITK